MGAMKELVVPALFILQTAAFPALAPEKAQDLSKRANPVFGSGFVGNQIIQISNGFKDACTLAQAAEKTAVAGNTIFNKYFPDTAATNVKKVFTNIIGGDTTLCASILADLTFRPDFADDKGELSCSDPEIMGETRGADTDNPTVIICPSALGHGGLTAGPVDGPDPVTCDQLPDRVTWQMETVGSVVLHEYTHFGNLVSPPLGQGTTDFIGQTDIYGPVQVQTRALAGSDASQTIADSYTWFANEAYWSMTCGRTFGLAQGSDDKDPNCSDAPCSEPASS